MGFEPMTSRLSAERANQAVPLAYVTTFIFMIMYVYKAFGFLAIFT